MGFKGPIASFRESRQRYRDYKNTEFRRTCERCAREWHVSRAQAANERMHGGKDTATKLVSSGAAMSGNGGSTGYILRATQKHDQAIATSHCPSCGSAAYSEEAVPIHS